MTHSFPRPTQLLSDSCNLANGTSLLGGVVASETPHMSPSLAGTFPLSPQSFRSRFLRIHSEALPDLVPDTPRAGGATLC